MPFPINPMSNLDPPKQDTAYFNNPLLGNNRHRIKDFAHYVHTHAIIRNRWFFADDKTHRHFMALHHEFQHANIYKVARVLTDEPPRFIRAEHADDPMPEEDEAIAQFWNDNRLTDMLYQFIVQDRIHGWALYYPFNRKLLPPYYTGPPWQVYSALEVVENKDKRNKLAANHPTAWKRHIDGLEEADISITQCVFWNSAQTIDWEGIPEGLQIWDDLVDYTFIKESLKGFDQRLGNGFLVMPIDQAATPTEETNIKNAIRNVRTEMGITVRQNKDNPLKPEWLTPQPGSDFVEHLSKYEEMFAAGMGFPLRWLKGDPHGAVESGQTDSFQVQVHLRQIFKRYIPFIKAVLKFHKIITTESEIDVLPGLGLEHSEMEKAQLDELRTSTIAQKDWLTDNEKRALDGMPPAEGGDELPAQQEQVMAEEKQNQQESPKLDSFLTALTDSTLSVRELGKLLNVSASTISKMRETAALELRPKPKLDCIELHTDSVALENDIFEYSGLLLEPQTKFYEQHGYQSILPAAEIQRIFNDPTYPKEFRIGITPSDDHASQVPNEVLEPNAIGAVRYERLEGDKIYGKVRIDLAKADKVIGPNNWLREFTATGQNIPLSVARWTVDMPSGTNERIESNIDIRSYVATRSPRNAHIGVQ